MKLRIAFLLDDCESGRVSLLILAGALLCFVVAGVLGISDNPPGILFVYVGAMLALLAAVRGRARRRKYFILMVASVITFPVAAVLHNVLEVAADQMGGPEWLAQIMAGLGVLFFFGAIIFSPAGFLLGLIGMIFSEKPGSTVSEA